MNQNLRSPSWVERGYAVCVEGTVMCVLALLGVGWIGFDWAIAGALTVGGAGLLTGLLMWMFGRDHEELVLRRRSHLLCVRCHYALEGLGAQGVCPECGLEYSADRVQEFWRMYLLLVKEGSRSGE